MSQNIFKIVWYIENSIIKNQWKLQLFTVFRVTPKIKIDIVKNWFRVKIPVFINFLINQKNMSTNKSN